MSTSRFVTGTIKTSIKMNVRRGPYLNLWSVDKDMPDSDLMAFLDKYGILEFFLTGSIDLS